MSHISKIVPNKYESFSVQAENISIVATYVSLTFQALLFSVFTIPNKHNDHNCNENTNNNSSQNNCPYAFSKFPFKSSVLQTFYKKTRSENGFDEIKLNLFAGFGVLGLSWLVMCWRFFESIISVFPRSSQ